MTLRVLEAGPQTTVQGEPRTGQRHLGIPASGPADGLSMALANHLVSNAFDAAALEITIGGFSAVFDVDTAIALTGAEAAATLDGEALASHTTIFVRGGQKLDIGHAALGMRIYLAVAGGIRVPEAFGSTSTYMPAAFGGHEGRALVSGDRLRVAAPTDLPQFRETPLEVRPRIDKTSVLRVVPSVEFDQLTSVARRSLFSDAFTSATQIDRMGVRLENNRLEIRPGTGSMTSSAVFPGTVQCPEGGEPVILGVDSQTTGGYPRIVSVIGADLHHLGQIRPRQSVRFFLRTPSEAIADDAGRQRLLGTWLR